jgi:O-acetylhomoserine (thiol)-lyase
MRDLGTCLSPFNAFLLLLGLETLSLRVERHCRNAEKIALFLKGHPHVDWVNYPALEGDKYYGRYKKYMPGGAGGIMAFGVKGGKEPAARAIGRFKIISHLANVADAKTLAIHPASTTHSQMSDEALISAGIAPEMIRLSVGLEDADDLIEDLNFALSQH